MAKKRKKSVAKKRKKQNLAGMDFASLVNLRTQVESALSGHRTTLEKQLAALGGSMHRLVENLPAVGEEAH